MKQLVLIVVWGGCGTPRTAPISSERATAPPDGPVVAFAPDAAVDGTALPFGGAAGRGRGPAVDAAVTIDAPVAACWEQGVGQRVQVVRVRVRDGGSTEVHDGDKIWGVDYAELDVVDVISGDMTNVLAPFRKRFYVSQTTGFCHRGGVNCGIGVPRPAIPDLIAAKGEQRIVMVALPPQGTTDDVIPPALRARYGNHTPMLFRVCADSPLAIAQPVVPTRSRCGPTVGPVKPGGIDRYETGVPSRIIPLPDLAYGVATISAGYDPDVALRSLRRNTSRLEHCLFNDLVQNTDLRGTVTLKFTIGGDGKVTAACAHGIATGVETCVAEAATDIVFPAPQNAGSIEVTVPLVFTTEWPNMLAR